MARKVFISILGTGYYKETSYFIGNTDNAVKTRFIQEAALKLIAKNFSAGDKAFVFLTPDAKKINWVNPAQKDNKYNEQYDGLSLILGNKHFPFDVEPKDIPNGNNEKEIWGIFQSVFDVLEDNDEVYFDITHAFRSIPMLVMVLINYAKFLKKITVMSITYGNWENRKDDFSEIIDITSFSSLQDWTSGASDYINYGDAKKIHTLIEQKTIPLITENSNDKFLAISIKGFSKTLYDFTQNIRTVRGYEIYTGNQSLRIKNDINKIREQSVIKPIIPLLEKIEQNNFQEQMSLNNIFSVVEYCINHNLVQQGITFFQEGIISFVLEKNCINWYVKGKDDNHKKIELNRNLASSALNYIERSKTPDFNSRSWDFSYWDKGKIDKLISDNFLVTIAPLYTKLSKLRNDINHSGYIEKRSGKDFLKGLREIFNNFNIILNSTSLINNL